MKKIKTFIEEMDRNKLKQIVFLLLLSVFCFLLSVFRILYSDTFHFIFLNWNLFLAFVPWFLTSILIIKPKFQKFKILIFIVLLVWLLFFPNSPYILTDLFHLKHQSSMPIWFDLILILSFAWTGLLFGFFSLMDIEMILGKFFKKKIIILISILFLFIGSFGVYIGRYLRWNSWDILKEPFLIFYQISDKIINPLNNLNTWGMTLFLGLFLSIIYLTFRILKRT